MTATVDISEVAEQLAALRHREGQTCFAVVLPLEEGRSEVVREFLEEGPPFDPAAAGLTRHTVFLTDREAIFVFETEDGVRTLERLLSERELWDAASAWERCAAEKPRAAAAVYTWPEPAEP